MTIHEVVDFSFDIVEVEGKARSKRGKMSGRKQTFYCRDCEKHILAPYSDEAISCACGSIAEPLLVPWIKEGRVLRDLPRPQDIRRHVLEQLDGRGIEPAG